MKNLKKLLLALIIGGGVFAFFGCSDGDDTEVDETLQVEFIVSGNESEPSRTVEMKAPSGYENKGIKIVYTLDESTPEIKFIKEKYDSTKTDQSLAEYIDYGTASLYDSAVTIAVTSTIKARAFYVDATSEKCVMGSEWSTTTVKVTPAANTTKVTGTSSGDFTFTLASTGNSNTNHYFDTSSTNVFKLNDEHPTVYYQTAFSWKGKGKGNWYLYMRDLNGGLVKKDSGNFLANGTYTGACFDDSKGAVADGELVLVNGTDSSSTGTVTITEKSKFTLAVNNTGASSTEGTSDTLGTFTVADAK